MNIHLDRGYYLSGYIPIYYPASDTRFSSSGLVGESQQLIADIDRVSRAIGDYETKISLNWVAASAGWGPSQRNIANFQVAKKQLNDERTAMQNALIIIQNQIANPPAAQTYQHDVIANAAAPVPVESEASAYSYSNTPIYTTRTGQQTIAPINPNPTIKPLTAFALPAIAIAISAFFKS